MDATIIGTVLYGVQRSVPVFRFPTEVTETVEGDSRIYVFKDVSEVITEVTFENNSRLEVLGSYTFYKCSKITKVDFSNCRGLRKIQNYCFSSCTNLANVVFAADGAFETLGEFVFTTTKISEIHFPKSFKSFSGSYVFSGSLKKVTFDPECKISQLGTWTFSTSGLNEFTIPKYVTSMSGNALQGTQLKEFVLHPENKHFNVYECNLYTPDNTSFINVAPLVTEVKFHPNCNKILKNAFMWSMVTDLVIPSHVYLFEDSSFYTHQKLISITIENGTTISKRMFRGALKLASVALPPTLEVIGELAFSGTESLMYLFVPRSVHTITNGFAVMRSDVVIKFESGSPFSYEGSYLYNEDRTTIHAYFGSDPEIRIKESVVSIDGTVFKDRSEIVRVIFEGDRVEVLGEGTFQNTVGLKSIEIPKSVKTISPDCFRGSGIVNLTIHANIETIGKSAFEKSGVESVVIEEGVKSLPESCFSNCVSLKEITIPRSLSSIGLNCFINSHVNSITFLDSPSSSLSSVSSLSHSASEKGGIERKEVKEETTLIIGESAFQNCQLVRLTMPMWVSKISAYSFMGNPLEEVDLGQTVIESTERGVFKDCERLNRVYFPSTMTRLEKSCFENSGLTKLSIIPSVEVIEPDAFRGCLKLEGVIIESKSRLKEVGSSSFRGCRSLRKFDSMWTTTNYYDIDGALVGKEESADGMFRRVLVAYPPAKKDGEYTVPDSIEVIGASGFLESKIEETILKENVREIRSSAFEECLKLKHLTIENENIIFNELSMNGIRFGCGMITAREDSATYNKLIELSVPRIALQGCPTGENEYFDINVIRMFIILNPIFEQDLGAGARTGVRKGTGAEIEAGVETETETKSGLGSIFETTFGFNSISNSGTKSKSKSKPKSKSSSCSRSEKDIGIGV